MKHNDLTEDYPVGGYNRISTKGKRHAVQPHDRGEKKQKVLAKVEKIKKQTPTGEELIEKLKSQSLQEELESAEQNKRDIERILRTSKSLQKGQPGRAGMLGNLIDTIRKIN